MSASDVVRGALELAAGLSNEGSAKGVAALVIAIGIPGLAAAVFVGLVTRAAAAFVFMASGALGLTVAFFAHVRTHTPSMCHDCYSGYGGAYHPIELIATVTNVAAWGSGILLALLVRERVRLLRGGSRLPRLSS